MSGSNEALASCRARIAAGHERVVRGLYAEALAAFSAALPELRDLLGARHEEVVELVADMDTVRAMQGVAALHREVSSVPGPGDDAP